MSTQSYQRASRGYWLVLLVLLVFVAFPGCPTADIPFAEYVQTSEVPDIRLGDEHGMFVDTNDAGHGRTPDDTTERRPLESRVMPETKMPEIKTKQTPNVPP